jgi:hypothetical protein
MFGKGQQMLHGLEVTGIAALVLVAVLFLSWFIGWMASG